MSRKHSLTKTKTFDGKRYEFVGVHNRKSTAQSQAKGIWLVGALARVVELPKAPKGKSGYLKTHWAVYAKY